MKILKITIFTVIAFSISINNVNSQSVNYKVIEDDPYYHNLDVSLMPFYTDFAPNNNLSLGYGLNASAQYKKLGTARLYIQRPYSDGTDWNYHFGTVGIFSSPTVNKLKKYLHIELGGTYNLSENTKIKNKKVVLSSYTSGRTTTTSYIMVPATVRRVTGVRGGLYNYHTAITARQNGTENEGVISTDGSRFGGAARLNPVGVAKDTFFNTESATNMKVLGIYGGLSFTSYHRIMINSDGYGTKGGSRYTNIFLDAMIAPVRIDDFEGGKGEKYDVSGKGALGFKARHWGARIGYEYLMTKNKLGYYARTEMGFKPGLASSKFYVSLGFGICFITKIQKLASAE